MVSRANAASNDLEGIQRIVEGGGLGGKTSLPGHTLGIVPHEDDALALGGDGTP